MALHAPIFTLDRPNTNAAVTDAEWWFWLRLEELERGSQLSGIHANKSGFHATGAYNLKYFPNDYSIRDSVNKIGPWWFTKASALDWTFPEAQTGNYTRIAKYTSRLLASAQDPLDPRLDLILFEFYGQSDTDKVVEGFNEFFDRLATSDSSHLWHLHFSFLRSKCGDFWGMWALLTVLMGWSVARWRRSITKEVSKMQFLAKADDGGIWLCDGMKRRLIAIGPDSENDRKVVDIKYLGSVGAISLFQGPTPGGEMLRGFWRGVNDSFGIPVIEGEVVEPTPVLGMTPDEVVAAVKRAGREGTAE